MLEEEFAKDIEDKERVIRIVKKIKEYKGNKGNQWILRNIWLLLEQ